MCDSAMLNSFSFIFANFHLMKDFFVKKELQAPDRIDICTMHLYSIIQDNYGPRNMDRAARHKEGDEE